MCNRFLAWLTAGLLLLPLAMSGQQKKSCWLRDANSPAASTAYLLCEQGSIWTSADAGRTWSALETGATSKLRAFSWIDKSRGVAVGDEGTILATADGGQTWQPREAGVKEHLMDITFVGESGWISGYRGTILHSTDGGKTWARQKTSTTMTLECLFFLDATHGWSGGWSGTILRTVDGGNTWTNVKSDASQWTIFSINFKDPNNGWATGFSGTLIRTKDGGATWTKLATPVKNSLSSIGFDNAGHGWVTYDDGFLMSADAGETWKPVPAGGRFFLGKLLPIDNTLWAVGQQVVLGQTGDGTTWKRVDSLVVNSTIPSLLGTRPK